MQTPTSTYKRRAPYAPKKKQRRMAIKGAKTTSSSGSLMLQRIPRGIPTGCPQSMRIKLVYHTTATLNAVAGSVIGTAAYRANAPNDPEAALGGGQPRYYDQWSAIYNSVTTLSSRCTIEYANEEANNASTFMNQHVGVAHTSQVALPGVNLNDALELNYNQHKIASGNNPVRCSVLWKPEQYFIGKTIYDEDIASDVNTTPVRECFFHVYTAATAPGAVIGGRTFTVKLEYDVIFFDKRYPTAS